MSDEGPTKVAIACQGGSHTAFTAGVLKGLLSEWDDGHELVGISGTSGVGISGTSGGAFNALATWYGLVTAGEDRAVDLSARSGTTSPWTASSTGLASKWHERRSTTVRGL